ncbi:MAG: BatA domain-containing protein [Verrucomicrobia bacterium]|nr:BatA domain-containing protein [Verrucomicrobiota bacterium]
MSFLAPFAFVFAAALPVVVLFYLLKRKRVVKLVPSTLLWQKFLAETQASAPFQKLRHNWLLVLQLLLLALAVLALARPYLTGNARPTRLRVVILDGSASMQSTDESPTPLRTGPPGSPPPRGQPRGWRTDDRPARRRHHRGQTVPHLRQGRPPSRPPRLFPGDTPTRLAEALRIAGAFTFEKRGEEQVAFGEIHLFSDGAAADLEELANENLPLTYHRIGQRARNAGIVNVDVRAHPEDPGRRALFAGVFNASTDPLPARLELWFEEQLVETRALDLAPAPPQPLVFAVTQDRDGLFRLRLEVEDDLAADNEAAILSVLPCPPTSCS